MYAVHKKLRSITFRVRLSSLKTLTAREGGGEGGGKGGGKGGGEGGGKGGEGGGEGGREESLLFMRVEENSYLLTDVCAVMWCLWCNGFHSGMDLGHTHL